MKKTSLYKILAYTFTCLFIGGLSSNAYAQNNSTRSPYSRYAFGELVNTTSIATKGMANVGISIRNPFIVNSANAASYSSVDSMTFILDMGISSGFSILEQGQKKDNRVLGNLDYISVLFPVAKHMGVSAGIHKIAERGYLFGSIQDTKGNVLDPLKYKSLFTGSGNIDELYLGFGAHIYKGLSVGVNADFVFGNEGRWRQIAFFAPDAYNPIFRSETSLRGYKMDLGVQYERRWGYDDESFLVLGATFSPKATLDVESKNIDVVTSQSSGATFLSDGNRPTMEKYKTNLPMQIGLGGSLSIKQKYLIAGEVNYQKWSDVSIHDFVKPRDVIHWATGFQFTPDARSSSLLSKSNYRLGLSGDNSYFTFPIDGKESSYYNIGASMGIGFPLVDRRSRINISFDYKYLLPSSTNMVKEQYIGISLGILFNGNWFRKAQVD